MKKTLIISLLMAGLAHAVVQETTYNLVLPEAGTVTNGYGGMGGTAEAVLDWAAEEVLDRAIDDEIRAKGVYAGNNSTTTNSMTGTEVGQEGYWSGNSITLAGRYMTGGESCVLILDAPQSVESVYSYISSVTLSLTIEANEYFSSDVDPFDFGIGLWNSTLNDYTKTETTSVKASSTEDTEVTFTLFHDLVIDDISETDYYSLSKILQENYILQKGVNKIVIATNGPRFEPPTGTYVVSDYEVQATMASVDIDADAIKQQYLADNPNMLKMTENGQTDNSGYGVPTGGTPITRDDAMLIFAEYDDGAYMFNSGGKVGTDPTTGEGIMDINELGISNLTLAPREGAGGSGEVIVLSADELNGMTVNDFTLKIADSVDTMERDLSLTLTLAVLHYQDNAWSILESATGSITLGSGSTLVLDLENSIERWNEDYKVVAVIDNLDNGHNSQYSTYNAALYTLYGIEVHYNTVTVPEPTTATLSLLALAGLCARRRRA